MNGQTDTRAPEFLETVRIGIDFGEHAGGIAVVKGTRILHAETYLDDREATLEQRRMARRGRRTRHAKKMRLARLRSWALRQEIPPHVPGARSKNGKTCLPDPYTVLSDPRLWVQPGVYQRQGSDPRTAPNWIERAKTGHVNAEEFVRAIALIFKKRGYKYDDEELFDYDDTRLIEFLSSCCQLEQAAELRNALAEEVHRRQESKLKPNLQAAFEAALTRITQPRKAVPRQIRERELAEIIDGVGRQWPLDEATIRRWKRELIGDRPRDGNLHHGLLNKTLRQARFENRLRSGCSWCGKKTPRLKKPEVREQAFQAAVANLRVRDGDGRRPLRKPERQPFLEWWNKRQQERNDGFTFPKGAKVFVTDRAPSEENLRRYLDQIGVEKRWLRDGSGRSKFDVPMLPQLHNLLNRVPRNGRASLCMEHLQLAAQGKTMKDAGVEWQTLRVRQAPNPKREQHDLRVLNRLENILFHKGRQGEMAWRYGPVALITLEVPKPQTDHAARKQQMAYQPLSLRERLHQETKGRCAYCEKEISVTDMEMEHVVPRARGGPDIRINRIASCHACNHPDTGKGKRLPSEWLTGDRWSDFQRRVQSSSLPEAKKALLLLPSGSSFPDDPTPLARVSSRTHAFILGLMELFKRYGVTPPTLEYRLDSPHVQQVGGEWTRQLRLSWLYKDREARQENFPEKNRANLFNHAQDAVLLAATPPHTWRQQIFIDRAIRPCAKRDETGAVLRAADGGVERELRLRPGIARLDLAPDWAGFMQGRAQPIVRPLGKAKASWKHQLFLEKFYMRPEKVTARLAIHVPAAGTGPPRRQVRESNAFGTQVQIPIRGRGIRERRYRKALLKPGVASEAVICWRDPKGRKGNLTISLQRPRALRRLMGATQPTIPKGAVIVGRLRRGEMIRLRNGFYRVKELAETAVTVIPEHAVTDQLAERLGIPKTERPASVERLLGKQDLLRYFAGIGGKRKFANRGGFHADDRFSRFEKAGWS